MARDDSFTFIRSQSKTENSAFVIAEGNEIAQATFALIEQAQSEIISLEFLLRDDDFGLMKMALLRRKAREGKKVKIHVDAFHLMVEPAIIWNLMSEGIELTVFNKLSLRSVPRMSFRNHSKGLIVDRRFFKTGDSNSGNEYVHWGAAEFRMKSVDVVLEGPIARDAHRYASTLVSSSLSEVPKFQLAAKAEVEEQRKQIRTLIQLTKLFFRTLFVQMDAPEHIARPDCILLTDEEVTAARARLDEAENKYDQQRLASPLEGWRSRFATPLKAQFFCDPIEAKSTDPGVNKAVIEFIKRARQRLDIVSPYLILTDELKQTLQDRLGQGIDVHFYTNSLQSTDNHTTQMAYEYRLEKMSDLGAVFVHEYQGPETLHAKFMVADHDEAMIMTYNIDWRSESKNLEAAVEFSCPEISNKLRAWLREHSDFFKTVVAGGQVQKSLVAPSTPAEWLKKVVILSIEKHL